MCELSSAVTADGSGLVEGFEATIVGLSPAQGPSGGGTPNSGMKPGTQLGAESRLVIKLSFSLSLLACKVRKVETPYTPRVLLTDATVLEGMDRSSEAGLFETSIDIPNLVLLLPFSARSRLSRSSSNDFSVILPRALNFVFEPGAQ